MEKNFDQTTDPQLDEPLHLPPLGEDFELLAQGCDLSDEGTCESCQ